MMDICDHNYTHLSIRIAQRRGQQFGHVQIYCLVCGKTTAINDSESVSTDWQSAIRQALPELDALMADFGIPGAVALSA